VVRWSGLLKALFLIMGLCLVAAILPLWQSRRYGFLYQKKKKGFLSIGGQPA
jgi:hypothetical protein